MIRTAFATVLLFCSSIAFACPMADKAAFESDAAAVQKMEGAHATFYLTGMTCGSCSGKVQTMLNKVEGVLLAAVDYQSGRVDVAFDDAKTDKTKLETALGTSGFKLVEAPKG